MPSRKLWIDSLVQIADPIYSALAEAQLTARMPVNGIAAEERKPFAMLEAIGRSLAGIAPWLENNNCPADEAALRDKLRTKVNAGLQQAFDSRSPDFVKFEQGQQPLVDAAFLAQGLLRGWKHVWLTLDSKTQAYVIDALLSTRRITPHPNNWLLFSAMIEAFLCRAGAEWDRMRVDYAIRQHMQWYKGDGVYGDGHNFHWDYYNSYVIQPMLYDIVFATGETKDQWSTLTESIKERLIRLAVVQERTISPEGTYPPLGRSLTYRIGAFQALTLVSLKQLLPDELSPAAVRSALTAVLTRQMKAPDTFDENGWLRIGFSGSQPSLGESYISTGSLYLCLCGYLHLGLPADDIFWTAPDTPWTSKLAWSGVDIPCDHAI